MRRLLLFLVLLGTVAAPGVALAAPATDLRGTWTQTTQSPYGGGTSTVTISTMDCSTGAFSGSGAGGSYSWSDDGTLNGTAYSNTEVYSGIKYTAYYDGTVTGPDSISGSFRDSLRGGGTTVVGTFTLVRTSPSPGAGCSSGSTPTPTPTLTPDPAASPTPTPDPLATPAPTPTRHTTATQVMCTYVVLTSTDTCTATVGDASATPTSPTGSVVFEKTEGVFGVGDTCQLTSSPSAPSTASCSVQYQRPTGSTKFPEIAANYGGDATHAPSRGATTFLLLGGPPTFRSDVPNQISFSTNADANGTKIRTCASTGGATGKRTALALRLAAGPFSSTIRSILTKVKTADPSALPALEPSINAALQQAVVDLNTKSQQLLQAGGDAKKTKAIKAEIDDIQGTMELLQKAMEGSCTVQQTGTRNATRSAVAAAAKTPAVLLGSTTVKGAKAGPVPLTLRLDKKKFGKAVNGKKTLDVYVRIITVTPSGLLKKGLPRMTVKKVVVGSDGKLVP